MSLMKENGTNLFLATSIEDLGILRTNMCLATLENPRHLSNSRFLGSGEVIYYDIGTHEIYR